MSQYKDILDRYTALESMKMVAADLNISYQTVRRSLITAGLFTSERAERIQHLYASGMPIKNIAELLKISTSSVSSYLPYSKGPRKDWEATVNSMRIKKCREKKKLAQTLKADD